MAAAAAAAAAAPVIVAELGSGVVEGVEPVLGEELRQSVPAVLAMVVRKVPAGQLARGEDAGGTVG